MRINNKTKKKRYDHIGTYFTENLSVVIPLVLTALAYNSLMCFLPVLEGKTINSLNTLDYENVKKYCLIFFALVLFVQINRFFKRYLVRVFSNKMSLRMREISFNNLLKKDLSYFTENTKGDILNRNLSDIYDTCEGVRKMTTEVFDTFVLLIGYLVVMLYMDPITSLLCLIFPIVSILFSHAMKKSVYKSNKEYKEYLSKNKDITITRLNNELYYRGFGVSEDYYKEYEQSTDELKKKSAKALIFHGSFEPLYLCVAMAGACVAAYFSGKNVINGVYNIGVMTSFLTTYALVAKKVGKVGKLFNAFQAFKVSWKRCKNCLTETEEGNLNFELEDIVLKVENLTYSYEGFSLPRVSFEAKKGEIIGVCGRVHTGKSTLLKALGGLYDYEGNASFGGFEIKEFRNNTRQYISSCNAGVFLFSDTLENNIRLNRQGDLENAIIASGLEPDLEKIGGLQEQLSRTNANLSGGQQKRLLTARALYPKDARLILLDDPFRSVDKALSLKMIEEIEKYNEQIVIVVSNRRDILNKTNRIVLLEENSSKVGTFEELEKDTDFVRLMEV